MLRMCTTEPRWYDVQANDFALSSSLLLLLLLLFFCFVFLLLGIQLNLVLLTEDLVVPGGCYHVPTVLCRPRRVLLTMDSEKSLELYRFDSISYKKNWKKKTIRPWYENFPFSKIFCFSLKWISEHEPLYWWNRFNQLKKGKKFHHEGKRDVIVSYD